MPLHLQSLLSSVSTLSDNYKLQLAPSIRSCKLWCQARALLAPMYLATKMFASKLIHYFSSHPAAFGFWSSTPPDNNTLTSANRKADQSLSDFQTGVGAAAHATLDREQLISHLKVALVDTLSSLPNSEGGIIPVSEVHGLPSTYLVRWMPCLWITSLLRLICVMKVVQCLLFFRGWSARYWAWQQAWYYSYPSIHSYPSQCGGQLSVLGSETPRVASSSSGSSSFSTLGPSRGGPAGIISFQSMPALLHLGISTPSRSLVVEWLQPSLNVSGKLHVSSCIISSSSIHISGGTCQRSTQMFDSGGTMLDGGSLAPHNS